MATVLSVALQNHPGSLAEILEILARAEINVDAIEADAHGDFGTVRIVAAKSKLASDLLRQDGYDVVESEALELVIPNKHGELAKLVRRLADNKVNVVSLYGTTPSSAGEGRLLLRAANMEAAKKVLGERLVKK